MEKRRIIIESDRYLTEDGNLLSNIPSLIERAIKSAESFELKFIQKVSLEHNNTKVTVERIKKEKK